MPPRTLVEICIRVAIENQNLITSLANMPDYCRQEILKGIKSPAVLYELEQHDERLVQETEAHWKKFIERDFPHLKRKGIDFAPTIKDQWSTAYDQYKRVDEIQTREAEEKLKATFSNLNNQAEKSRAGILPFAATKYLIAKDKKQRRGASGFASFSGSPRPDPGRKNNALDKAKREARLASQQRAQARTPTAMTTLKKAPVNMVDAKRIARQPEIPKIRPVRVPAKDTEIERQGYLAKESEARLIAIKNQVSSTHKPQQRPAAASLPPPSRAAPEVVDDDDEDDLFGDKEFAASSPESAGSPPSSQSDMKRKRGILSNKPGANSRHLGRSPPKPAAPKPAAHGAFMPPRPKPAAGEPASKRQRYT